MKPQQHVFSKLKTLIAEHFAESLLDYGDDDYATIGDSGIYFFVDEQELAVGYHMAHRHFNPEYDDLREAVDYLFWLICNKKRITYYFKGNFFYQHKIEIETPDAGYINLGTVGTWLFPYWKKTRKEVEIVDGILDKDEIAEEIATIRKNAL